LTSKLPRVINSLYMSSNVVTQNIDNVTINPGRISHSKDWEEAHQSGRSETLLRHYARMRSIRHFERRCSELSAGAEPLVAGSVHTCLGQEAIPVGAMSCLRPDDYVVATYRGHGWVIESGVPLEPVLAEVAHRATGINGGRAGSAMMMAQDYGLIAENSIIGAGIPIAAGVAMALQKQGKDGVVLTSFGDGAMSQGGLHEGMVFAAAENLPMIMICENNGWSELTRTSKLLRIESLTERAKGCGIRSVIVDGCDPVAVANAVADAAKLAREGKGPTFIECDTIRLGGHYNGDIQHYRPKDDIKAAAERDPLVLLGEILKKEEIATAEQLAAMDEEIIAEIEQVIERVRQAPLPDPDTASSHVVAPVEQISNKPNEHTNGQQMTYGKAVNEALRIELGARPELLAYGEDVGHSGGIFGIHMKLQADFGAHRVFDTPIAEAAILGSALGSSLLGMKPVVEIMWADFMLVAMDQLINQMANIRYVTEGKRSAPVVVRTQQGSTPGSCPQHSQCLEVLVAHIPGLKVGMPATPADAHSMLRAAIADPDPCILFECRGLYKQEGPVATDLDVEPVGGARLTREGSDLAIISWGRSALYAKEAADLLADEGISAAVLDLRWLSPLDTSAIDAVVNSCGGQAMIVHEANLTGGFGGEIAAGICERLPGAKVSRLGTPDTRIPASPVLSAVLIPDAKAIVAKARTLLS
jgi:2-oxoisovalerate dehydrogenase E1 component